MRVEYRVEKWVEVHDPSPAMLRLMMEREGYSVFQWCDQPGAEYGLHQHNEDQCHWIVSGTLELTIEGFGVVVLEAGDRDYMPANTYHSARVVGEEPVLYLIGSKN